MSRKRLGVISFLLAALEGMVSLGFLLSVPADPKNAVWLGYSSTRLVTAGGILFGTLVCSFVALFFLLKPGTEAQYLGWFYSGQKYGISLGLSFLLLMVTWTLVWMPFYRFGAWQSYAERFWPVVLWLTLISLQNVTFLLVFKTGLQWQRLLALYEKEHLGLLVAVGAFGGAIITLMVIFVSGWGLDPDAMHWNGPGVPVLGLQILAAWIFSLAILWLSHRVDSQKRTPWVDVFIALMIWVAAAVTWTVVPAQRSYFAPGPNPPNLQAYPFSDAEVYDLGAQYGLIGQGFNNWNYVDKPLYTFFLFIFHLIGGQSVPAILFQQNLLLALIPVLVFLLGKQLYNRGAGCLGAALVIFWNINAFSASLYVQAVHSKLLMSEIPTALMLVLFTLLLVTWLNSSGDHLLPIMAAGGVLGLTTLVRHNPWLLLPFVLVLIFIRYARAWRKWVSGSFVFLFCFAAVISPWMWRSARTMGTPWYFMIPLQGTVIQNRYEPSLLNATAVPGQQPSSEPESEPGSEVMSEPGSSPDIMSEPTGSSLIPSEPGSIPFVIVSPTAIPSEPQSEAISSEPFSEPSSENISSEPAAQPRPIAALHREDGILGGYSEVISFILGHYFHNLITSVLVFPTSLVNDTLVQVIRQPGSFWLQGWNGILTLGEMVSLFFSLALISIGLGTAVRKKGISGAAPLVIFLVYSLATAVARTSGGRYIQPTQWIVFLYYGIGIIQVSTWLAVLVGQGDGMWFDPIPDGLPLFTNASPVSFERSSILAIFMIALVGLAIPLSESSMPKLYPVQTKAQLMEGLTDALVKDSGFNVQDLQTFLANPNAVITTGRVLYPRFYGSGQGEPTNAAAFMAMPFPRLVFMVIGADGGRRVVLPSQASGEIIPDGADVILLGCNGSGYTEGLGIIFKNGRTQARWREPSSPLTCPLKVPVCDNNHVCN